MILFLYHECVMNASKNFESTIWVITDDFHVINIVIRIKTLLTYLQSCRQFSVILVTQVVFQSIFIVCVYFSPHTNGNGNGSNVCPYDNAREVTQLISIGEILQHVVRNKLALVPMNSEDNRLNKISNKRFSNPCIAVLYI